MYHEQLVRYSRNISLPEIGNEGQKKLLNSRVLVVGAGGLGSPLILYLAASGIGTIGIIDDDRIALSNLQRQIIHEAGSIGQPKVNSAKDAIYDLNQDIKTITYKDRLNSTNVDGLIKDYDIIADCCDNFHTRFLLNEYCLKNKKILVSSAAIGFYGHLYTFKSYLGKPHPCYQCIYPHIPSDKITEKCSQSGVLGSLVGQMGTWQTTEIIKELLNIGTSLSGKMVILDALSTSVNIIKINRSRDCPWCGKCG
ncbi:molybdopterin-synthase adenylyltransferase MoeB [Anaplasmataceae bacterium AB001_6]|nr:molybdopterin-synthase adenylyltransferase MoeB [Anaplasmataceae bacterium AB001_6]